MSAATILVVEDDPLVRLHVSAALEDNGHVVMQGGCAKEAIDLLQANPAIRLVISDVKLPGGTSGLELVQQIRATEPSMPIVIASGLGENDIKAPEAVAILRKPFGIGALLTACEAAVSMIEGPVSQPEPVV